MGTGRADDSACQTRRPTTRCECARGAERDLYVLSTGCQWQGLPKGLPPKSTAHHYFGLWDWDGTLERIHHALYVETRERAGREASPSVAIIDSQTAKAAQKGALASTRKASM